MNIAWDEVGKHNLVKNAERKFDTLFKELQEMRKENDSPEFLPFIFLLETQLINLYYNRIMQNLKIIASDEPQLLNFNNTKELKEVALQRLTTVLSKYDHQHIAKLLKCTTLSANEDL